MQLYKKNENIFNDLELSVKCRKIRVFKKYITCVQKGGGEDTFVFIDICIDSLSKYVRSR